MNKLKGILVLALVLLLMLPGIVLAASNVSGAKYFAHILVSNNGTAVTNVATTCNISTQNLIDGGYLNSEANNCALHNSAGADLPFMPSVNATYPWGIWVSAIGANSYLTDILYTANSTGGKIRYFPGAVGMTTPDSISMELGDNFTITQSGWWDTSAGDNKTAVYKEAAFKTFVSPTVSENITSVISGIGAWVSPTGDDDPDVQWTNDGQAWNGAVGDYAHTAIGGTVWSKFLWLTIDSLDISGIRYYASGETADITKIDIDVYSEGAWHHVYNGTFTQGIYETKSFGKEGVTAAKVSLWNSAGVGREGRLHDFDFRGVVEVSVSATGVESGEHIVKTTFESLTDNFTTDEWTDVGVGVGVNVGNSRMEWDTTDAGESSYRDIGEVSDAVWEMQYTYRATTVGVNVLSGVGLIDEPNGDWGVAGAHDAIFMQINNLGVIARAWDDGARTSSGAIAIVANTTYYITLERVASDNMSLSIFTDAARTVHIAGSPQSKAIPATVIGLDTMEVAGVDTSAQSVGWLEDLGIPGKFLVIYIDGALKDSAPLSGLGVPNNSNDWAFLQNMKNYWEYHTISVNGTQVQYIDWEYDTTFQDSSPFDNDATPSFITASSDPDVSANMTGFFPVSEAKAPAFVLEEGPDFIDEEALSGNVTGTWTTTPASGEFPLAGVISDIAGATGTPAQLPLVILAGFVILALSLSVSGIMRTYGSGSVFVKILVICGVMGCFIAVGNFGIDFWMLIVFVIMGVALSMASRHTSWQ